MAGQTSARSRAIVTCAYRPAHRVSAARRHVRAELAVREALVRTRTRYIAIAKAFVRRDGLRVPSSESHLVAKRVAAMAIPAILETELDPLFAVLAPLNAQIAAADCRMAALEKADPIIALLATAPSVGPLTASAVVATIDDVTRFRSAHQFEAFLGLVPGERSSGEETPGRSDHEGRQLAGALSPRRGRMAAAPLQVAGDGGAPRMGAQDRRAPRQPDCGGGAGASACGNPLRDVARQRTLRRHEGPCATSALRARELVSAVRSFAPPNCAETMASHCRARTEG